ncbi:Lysine 2,3-aminomutase family protein [Salmonella enterica subsp. enterica serovar Johannesburg str. S5-703]|nr:Lysine 2,3-aminomutase family protein [Salmonella enterica subsp. enterica serovar Johannesburg str. S5-703]
MAHIVTLNTPLREDWLAQLADVVTNPDELLHLLQIEADENLRAGQDARRLFALRVPRAFIAASREVCVYCSPDSIIILSTS